MWKKILKKIPIVKNVVGIVDIGKTCSEIGKNFSEIVKNGTETLVTAGLGIQKGIHEEILFQKNMQTQEQFGATIRETNKLAVQTSNQLHEFQVATENTIATHSQQINGLETKFEHISCEVIGLKNDVKTLDCRITNVQNQVTNLSHTVNYINHDLQNFKVYTKEEFNRVYSHINAVHVDLQNFKVNTQKEFYNVYKCMDNINKDFQYFKSDTNKKFQIVEYQIQQTNQIFSERCNELANRILQDEKIAQQNNEAINRRFESDELHINNLYYMNFNNQQKISYLYQLAKKDCEAISMQAILIEKNFEISKTCIANIQTIYTEIGKIYEGITAVTNEVNELCQNQQKMKVIQDKIIEHTKLMDEKLSEIVGVLNVHTQIIVEHSLRISKLEECAMKQNEAMQVVFKEIQKNRSILVNHEQRIQNIENVLNAHERWLHDLDERTNKMSLEIEKITEKINKIRYDMHSQEIRELTMFTKISIDKMNDEQNIQFLEFLIYAKNSQIEFSPQQIYDTAENILLNRGW